MPEDPIVLYSGFGLFEVLIILTIWLIKFKFTHIALSWFFLKLLEIHKGINNSNFDNELFSKNLIFVI